MSSKQTTKSNKSNSPDKSNSPSSSINAKVKLAEAGDYNYKNDIEHMLDRPDTFIGSVARNTRHVWVLKNKSGDGNKITDEKVKATKLSDWKGEYLKTRYPAGMERLFLEILANAADNVEKTRKTPGWEDKVGEIKVTMTAQTITIRNGGVPIPVVEDEKDIDGKKVKLYIPEFIFGTLRSSSNFDDDDQKTYVGRNGYGAKLANVFSKRFSVVVADSINGKKYKQEWTDNMGKKGKPSITKYTAKTSFTEVSFDIDFNYKKFNFYSEYPQDAYYLYAQHAVNVGFINRIPVIFNEKKITCNNIRDYCRLMFGDEAVKTAVFHKEWEKGTETVKRNGVWESVNKGDKPLLEMCFMDTPDHERGDHGEHVSFINSSPTVEGGVHVNAAFKSVTDNMLTALRKKEKSIRLTIGDVKPHVTLVMNATLINPEFSSQSKTKLTGYNQKENIAIDIPKETQRKLQKWNLVDRLLRSIEAKKGTVLKKTDGKREKHVEGKFQDANLAGTKEHSKDCIAMLTEGDSASSYPKKWISFMRNGRDKYGVLPLGGKPLNTLKKEITEKNRVFPRIKKFLGLEEKADYTKEYWLKRLRYGQCWLLSDSDVDGGHINSLLLTYFYDRFPSLLKIGYIHIVLTPIIRVKIEDKLKPFYTKQQYDKWAKKTDNFQKYKKYYYKGLGSSEDSDIKSDMKNPKVLACVYDNDSMTKAEAELKEGTASYYFQLALGKKHEDKRKKWLAETQPYLGIQKFTKINISEIINMNMFDYGIASNKRAIPNYIDGLKPGQRKIVYCALYKTRGWTHSTIKSGKCEKKKVARFGAGVGEAVGYDHGEQCMELTLITMTQAFIGSNNMPFFFGKGQFGTRDQNGGDHSSSRYIYLHPEKWVSYIYRKEDSALYTRIIEDGEEQEPECMLPILPMHVINGCKGIGMGWATFIPNHHPEDVANWIIQRLDGKNLADIKPLKPWYRGFQGEIDIVERKPKRKSPGRSPGSNTPQARFSQAIEELEKVNKADLMDSEEIDGNEKAKLQKEEMERELAQFVDEADEEFVDDYTSKTMITKGSFKQKDNEITVMEIPLGRSIQYYDNFLKKMIKSTPPLISDYSNKSTTEVPRFIVKDFRRTADLKSLGLIKSFGISNMVLMNDQKRPVKYADTHRVMSAFYNARLKYYQKRKDLMLHAIKEDINGKRMRIQFIEAVAVTKTLEVRGKKKAVTLQKMKELQIPEKVLAKTTQKYTEEEIEKKRVELLKQTTTDKLSEEEIEKLRKEIEEQEREIAALEKTSKNQLWKRDIQEFLQMLRTTYPEWLKR